METYKRPPKTHLPNSVCAYCTKQFYKQPSHKTEKNCKSGLYFCTRLCKDTAQRFGGIKEISPHIGNVGIYAYRAIALRNKASVCERCGYCKMPEILEVHHKDRNRENNTIENLEVLCPNCHQEEHYSEKDGRYTNPHLTEINGVESIEN